MKPVSRVLRITTSVFEIPEQWFVGTIVTVIWYFRGRFSLELYGLEDLRVPWSSLHQRVSACTLAKDLSG